MSHSAIGNAMKSFNEILDSFKENTAMEFCALLSSVRAALEYTNEHVQSFQKIQFRGG